MSHARMPRLALTCLLLASVACAVEDDSAPNWTLRETLRIGSGDEGPTSFSWVKGIAPDSLGRMNRPGFSGGSVS
jgi:hypothetical protein